MAVGVLLICVWAEFLVIESFSDVVTGIVVILECLVPVSYFVEVLSDALVKALAIDMSVEVLACANVNVVAAVVTTNLELPMLIP